MTPPLQFTLPHALPQPVSRGLYRPDGRLRLDRPARSVSGTGRAIDAMIVGLMALAIILLLCVSSAMLTNWKIHYVTAGGNFYEKLHPATYLIFLAFCLLLIRRGNPVGELVGMFSDARLTFVYLLCWLSLLIQTIILERPFTVIVDTFLLPPVICLTMWQLGPFQKKVLALTFHMAILLNVILGGYEYISGSRLFPLTVGNIVVLGEWRSAALLGHPLTASGLVAAYVMALFLRPALFPAAVRLPLIAMCFASLMVFGGRTALLTTLAVGGLFVLVESAQFLHGKRTSLLNVILTLCLASAVAAIVVAALSTGVFDKMLLRFSSDKGSTLARFATLHFLSHFDWSELILGTDPVRVAALQSQLGLNYGIENFWISCVVQFGLVHTALITIGLACLFADIIRKSHHAVWAILLLILMIAAGSVSFSSKNIQMAQFIVLITLLLPRDVKAMDHSRSQIRPGTLAMRRSALRLNGRTAT